ncbi:hypothetical protein BGX26_003705 [Mortierella sp. AD094]|nr:hypothetical protein BGX26_003705 [Mortierella sp. AD094]
MATKERLIVLCDGTWCGSETTTTTNILKLAEMIGFTINNETYDPKEATPIPHQDGNVHACYFPGAGLGGTLLEYLFNGATGNDIDRDCIRVYEYIVKHYTPQHEIWMFGLSRGAYTVRCVAGMINNCGILKRTDRHGVPLEPDSLNKLYNLVYQIYRSRDPADHPEAPRSCAFKRRASHDVATPVKFMGLFDTVGSLGIPYLNPGIGLTFHEFHDNKISCVVEKVYHALSIHDRLWCFEPCRALPDKHRIGSQFAIHERWFPGCHYDIGRQRFQFLRSGENWLGRPVDNLFERLSKVIRPNEVLADLVLKWMLEGIKEHSGDKIIRHIGDRIEELVISMADGRNTGSGDVYGNILDYGPMGILWEKRVGNISIFDPITNLIENINDTIAFLGPIGQALQEVIKAITNVINAITNVLGAIPNILGVIPNFFGIDLGPIRRTIDIPENLRDNTLRLFAPMGIIWKDLDTIFSSLFLFNEFKIIVDVLAQTRDRRISDIDAVVTRYDQHDPDLQDTIENLGKTGRYPSHTYENFKEYLGVMRDESA